MIAEQRDNLSATGKAPATVKRYMAPLSHALGLVMPKNEPQPRESLPDGCTSMGNPCSDDHQCPCDGWGFLSDEDEVDDSVRNIYYVVLTDDMIDTIMGIYTI
ncbi:hypothetical protein BMS3Bbin04_00029 [bacterium BMS3Bbin04]|nr:hypothetical protein BMS3Bbin04_00029 [bacterium BMS3Bbin04]